uniref:Cystatin domain-containing protein n=2 Tax=Hordeum vulgare TaxID=4513 RepID=A0A8I6XNY0_HORVV
MRPSLPVLLSLLLAAFFAIVHAETDMAAAPSPSLATYLPPPLTPASTPVFLPPPPTPESTPVSPEIPPTPAWTLVSSPSPPPAASTPVSSPPPAPPAWTPVVDVNVQSIRQVGQFAVRIHALHLGVDLVFVKVVSCQTQPSDGGYIYQLVVAVTGSGAKSPQYNAVVWGILGTMRWELRSFKAK